MHRFARTCFFTLAALSVRTAGAQTCPTFAPPGAPTSTPVFEHRWGGLVHDVFTTDGTDTWTVEDGGRIRYSATGDFGTGTPTPWAFQRTPDSTRKMLRRVDFLANGLDGLAVGDGGTVVRTTDGGATWTELATIVSPTGSYGDTILFDVHQRDTSEAWVIALDSIQHTSDGGATWCEDALFEKNGLTPLDPVVRGLELYAIDFVFDADGLIGLAVAEPGLVLETRDGTNWVVIYDGYDSAFTPQLATACGAISGFVEPWDVELLAGSTSSSAEALMCSGIGHGCGQVFLIQPGLSQPVSEEFHECVTNPNCALTSWDHPKIFGALYGLATFDDGTAIVCGYGGQIVRRESAGGGAFVWREETDPLSMSGRNSVPMLGCDAGTTGSTAFVTGFWNTIRKTTDGGATFTNLPFSGPSRIQDVCLQTASPTPALWQVGQQGLIARSTDGGRTFTAMFGPSTSEPRLNSIAFAANGQRGIAVGANGRILGTVTAGSTWVGITVAAAAGKRLHEVDWAPGGHFFAAGTQGLVLHSSDGGATWVDENVNDTGATLHGIAMKSSTEGIVVGESGGAAAMWYYTPTVTPKWTPVTSSLVSGLRVLMDAAFEGTSAYVVGRDASHVPAGHVLAYNPSTNAVTQETLPSTPLYCVLDGALDDTATHTYDQTGARDGTVLNEVEIVPGTSEVFVGGDCGRVYHKVGTGSWSELRSETSFHLYGMTFLDSSTGYITGSYRSMGVILAYTP